MRNKLMMTLLTLSTFVFTGCYDDEIDLLNKKIKKLERITGTNEPIIINFSTFTGHEAVIKNTAYYFKSVSWSTSFFEDNGDDTYTIIVERAADVEWQSTVRFAFIYNPETDEAYGPSCRLDYLNNDGHTIDIGFFPGTYIDNSVTVSVRNFDPQTGRISLTIHATTSEESQNNSYPGQPMTLDLSFNGTLEAFRGSGE